MLHSGVDAPQGGRDARAPSGAQKDWGDPAAREGRGCLCAAPQPCPTTHHPPPFPGGARHRSRQTRGVHAVGTVSNDQPAGIIPRDSRHSTTDSPGLNPQPAASYEGSAGGSVAHPDTTPPTRQPFHRRSAAHHPRTGHPTHTTRDARGPAPRGRPATGQPTQTGLPRPMSRTPGAPRNRTALTHTDRHQRLPATRCAPHPCASTHRTASTSTRPCAGRPARSRSRSRSRSRTVDHEVSGDKTDTRHRQPHDRPDPTRPRPGQDWPGAGSAALWTAILQFEPSECPIRAVCGAPKCKIGEEGGVFGCSCPKGGGFAPHPPR